MTYSYCLEINRQAAVAARLETENENTNKSVTPISNVVGISIQMESKFAPTAHLWKPRSTAEINICNFGNDDIENRKQSAGEGFENSVLTDEEYMRQEALSSIRTHVGNLQDDDFHLGQWLKNVLNAEEILIITAPQANQDGDFPIVCFRCGTCYPKFTRNVRLLGAIGCLLLGK